MCCIPLWNIQKQQCILYAKFPQACQATCHRIAVYAWQKAHFSSDAQMFVCMCTHTHTHRHADITCLLRMSGSDCHYELLGLLYVLSAWRDKSLKVSGLILSCSQYATSFIVWPFANGKKSFSDISSYFHIYSGYGKYSDPLKFFTLCYIAAIC